MSLKKRKSNPFMVGIGRQVYGNSIADLIPTGARLASLMELQTRYPSHQIHVQEHVFEERLLREYEAQFIQDND